MIDLGLATELVIDDEFRSFIPSLKPNEFEQLESNIVKEGCRDAIVVWNNTIIDGHNRYEICKRHSIAFDVVERHFETRDDVKLWMKETQLGRRNLTDDQRAAIAYDVMQRRSAIAMKERAAKGTPAKFGKSSLQDTLSCKVKSQKNPQTRTAVAKEHKIPERKLRNVALVAKHSPESLAKIERGEMKIADAVRDVKRQVIVANLEDVSVREAKSVSGVYDVVVIDPPWAMEKIERDERPNQSEFDYPTMSETQLANMAIPCADDCHVWLWTTHRFLPMAFRLLESWGLKYVCCFTWHKPGGFQPIGLPQYNCEFALYARKGSPKFIDTKAFPTCFNAPRGKHSEKPEDFYDIVRRVTAGRRLDMFNRRLISGFDGWGKETV